MRIAVDGWASGRAGGLGGGAIEPGDDTTMDTTEAVMEAVDDPALLKSTRTHSQRTSDESGGVCLMMVKGGV